MSSGMPLVSWPLASKASDLHQPIQAAKRERMQQNPVDDAEQGRIGANPQRQNRNHNQRKPDVFPKAAKA